MRRSLRVFGLVALTVMAVAGFNAPEARATLIGDTVDLSWHEPTPTTLIEDDGTQVVGPGVEYPSVLANLFKVDIGASTLTISHTGNFATEPELGIAYYDVRLTDLTNPIVGATIDPANTLSDLTPADIIVANGSVSIDLVGILWGIPQQLVLDIDMPEPSPLMLLLSALAAFPVLRRLRLARV
jgi:hypothetical protein